MTLPFHQTQRQWSRSQVTVLKSILSRAIANTTLAKKSAPETTHHEFDADLQLFGLVKNEVENVSRGGNGNWRKV